VAAEPETLATPVAVTDVPEKPVNHDPFELDLEPYQQIREVEAAVPAAGKRWWSGGNDPAWLCGWPGRPGKALPGGWYVLDLSAEVHKGYIHNMRLYPDYGRNTFLEADGHSLPLSIKEGHEGRLPNTLVRFIDDVTRLRFDPSVVPCEFTMRHARMRRIGRREALRHLLGDSWDKAGSWRGRAGMVARVVRDLFANGPSRMADRLYHQYAQRRASQAITDYNVWLDFFDSPNAMRQEQVRRDLDALQARPLVSVVVPVYNTPEKWLRRCLDSVIEQSYPNWELCVADDDSTWPHVASVLQEYASRDPRIKVVRRSVNGHISAASNSALELATGRYVALLDHDDELHRDALLECVKGFEAHPGWRMLFTDEDKIDEEGVRSDPYFKPDWNPDLFLSQNCVCHLTVYERDLLVAAGGFRPGMEGAQDWDLTLRVAERLQPDEIGHVSRVLYHWRMIAGSTALAPGEKSYAHLAAMRAIQGHFERTKRDAQVRELEGCSGYFRIEYGLPSPAPLATLLIPTRDRADLLEQCIDSILEKTTYPNYEIVVIDNGSIEPETLEYFDKATKDRRVRVVRYDRPFNYSAINNFGASHARGEVIGLLNNDVQVIDGDWLREMVSHAWRPEIGVVGAMLYYPNDTIQHAGVILGIGGVAGHSHVGLPRGCPGDKHRAALAQSMSAVTAACAVLRAEVFREVGGLDESLQVAFNDVDLCLRVRERGYRNLWTPFAELYHHESASRGYEDTPEKLVRFRREENLMQERWGRALLRDPAYNPNLSVTAAPFSLAYPPRV
jgi:glycosyltransferase involved in cell wall biosynthesis